MILESKIDMTLKVNDRLAIPKIAGLPCLRMIDENGQRNPSRVTLGAAKTAVFTAVLHGHDVRVIEETAEAWMIIIVHKDDLAQAKERFNITIEEKG